MSVNPIVQIEAELKQLNASLHDKWPEPRPCFVCHAKSQWEYEGMTALPNHSLHSVVLVTPIVKLTCVNCGNTLMFDAIRLGLASSHEVKIVRRSWWSRWLEIARSFFREE